MAPEILFSNIQPDPIDLRDRKFNYIPTLKPLEQILNNEPFRDNGQIDKVKNQLNTSACTGFALSSMVEVLLEKSRRTRQPDRLENLGRISPFMLYYFARRYDEYPGETDADTGSSARGAMKAWKKHGACAARFWQAAGLPTATDWIRDAFTHPLGAYYRVDISSLTDMHAALSETGVLYVTAAIHEGWRQPGADGKINYNRTSNTLGGHAFLIVGYDENGFWIQNSWGTDWGKSGFAHLSYADWNQNAWDAWVAQGGVSTSYFLQNIATGLNISCEPARSVLQDIAAEGKINPTLYEKALLSTNREISAQQINPYIVDLENNGILSRSGSFTTTEEDLSLLVNHYIPSATADFGLAAESPIDIAIYAHGGLVNEADAEKTARTWIPALYANRIIPIFIMWETGFRDVIKNIFFDTINPSDNQTAGGFLDTLKTKTASTTDRTIEATLAIPGTVAWDEIKSNAANATLNQIGGLRKLYQTFTARYQDAFLRRFRFHLIGHSAGSIFHAHLLPAMINAGFRVDGLYFMAPALRNDLFETNILPHYSQGTVPCYTQFHLNDATELADNCMHAYGKSLLYLVSNAFERKRETPILGMEKFVKATPLVANRPNPATATWDWIASPTGSDAAVGSRTSSLSHGGFGTEPQTMASIINRITGRRP